MYPEQYGQGSFFAVQITSDIVGSQDKAGQVESISVDRTDLEGSIAYSRGPEKLFSVFRLSPKNSMDPDVISTRAIIPSRPLRRTAELLAEALSINSGGD